MADAREEFIYTPLESGEGVDTIRVIEIHAGSDQAPLCCTIRHVRLTDNPQYEALSYCWGDPALNQVIYCE